MFKKKNPAEIQDPKVKAKARREKRERFNHVWWLPLIALLLVSYIVVTHFTSKGTLVTISFSTAEGLEVNKTKVKYKDVIIGKVESIDLNPDFNGVQVGVRMSRSSEGLLKENTRFWIVKPRLTVTQVTGLSTLISGFYITLDPDQDPTSEYRYTFTGLETAPILTQDETGLNITLLADRASSLKPGTAVYYKGYSVGKVNRVYFSDDYLWVKADVSIESPHHRLIKPNTRFWSSNGIAISTNADGVDIQMESVETLIAGGITFETPLDGYALGNEKLANGVEFHLFDSKQSADEENIGSTINFVTYFDDNVQGLDEGAPVMIQGMKIGRVKAIQLVLDESLSAARIQTLFEIYESSLNRINMQSGNAEFTKASHIDGDSPSFITQLLRKGLRTQLDTSSFLTGKKHIALVFDREAPLLTDLPIDPLTKQPLLPASSGSGFDAIVSSAGKLLDKVNALPIEDIMLNINQLISSADNKINTINIDETIAHINRLIKNIDNQVSQLALAQTTEHFNGLLQEGKLFMQEGKGLLHSGRALSSSAQETLAALNQSVTQLSQSAKSVLDGYSADAPLYYNLNTSITQLNETLVSLKAVLDMLERHPNSLIFGEDKPQNPQEFYWDGPQQ